MQIFNRWRINESDINLMEVNVSDDLIREYAVQLAGAPFSLSIELLERIFDRSISIHEIDIEELRNAIEEYIPIKFYYFVGNKDLLSVPFLYTGITDLSFEQGGLFVLQCYNIQTYRLCNNFGDILIDYCHDLEIGFNGLIVWRSSDVCNKWHSGFYEMSTNVINDAMFVDFDCEKFLGSNLCGMDKLCSLESNVNTSNVIYSPDDLNDFERKFRDGFGNSDKLRLILFKDSVDLWLTAPWFIDFYTIQDIALLAVQRDFRVYVLLSDCLRGDPEILNSFLNSAPFSLIAVISLFYSPKIDIFNDLKLCIKWIKESTLCYDFMPLHLKSNEIILSEFVSITNGFQAIPENVLEDRSLVKRLLGLNGLMLKVLSADFKNDIELVLAAVMHNGLALEFASNDLKRNRKIVLKALISNGFALKYVPEMFLSDKEIIKTAVDSSNGDVLVVFDWLYQYNPELLNYRDTLDSPDDLPF